jgi:hypothetical protein
MYQLFLENIILFSSLHTPHPFGSNLNVASLHLNHPDCFLLVLQNFLFGLLILEFCTAMKQVVLSLD